MESNSSFCGGVEPCNSKKESPYDENSPARNVQSLGKSPSILDGVLRKEFVKDVALGRPAGDESGIRGRANPEGHNYHEEPQVSGQEFLFGLRHTMSLDESDSLQSCLNRIYDSHLEWVTIRVNGVQVGMKLLNRLCQMGKPVSQFGVPLIAGLLLQLHKYIRCCFCAFISHNHEY